MMDWSFDSPDPEATLEAGCALGRSVGPDGLAIALVGPLGAGKTVFVKGLAEGLGVDPRGVSSPTFVIAQEYPATSDGLTLHHVDLYRLEDEDELEAIGFYDLFGRGRVLAVEWADRFPGVLGRDYLELRLEGPSAEARDSTSASSPSEEVGPDSSEIERTRPLRRVTARALGASAERVLEDWARRLDGAPPAAPRRGSAEGRSPENVPSGADGQKLNLVLALLGAGLVWSLLGAPGASDADRVPGCAVPIPASRPATASGWRFLESQARLEGDALGTIAYTCASASWGDARDPASSLRAPVPFEGIGRLLVGGTLNLNRATAHQLALLPGIGAVRAEAIHRAAPFATLAELERVPGIGPKMRARLAQWVSIGDEMIEHAARRTPTGTGKEGERADG